MVKLDGLSSKNLSSLILFSLLITFFLGSLYRLQLTGLSYFIWLYKFNLRDAHSHLGFYGAMIPITWVLGQQYYEAKLFSVLAIKIYYVFIGVAIIGFFFGGYNLISNLGTAVILFFWIHQSIRSLFTFKKNKTGLLVISPLMCLISMFFLLMIPFIHKISDSISIINFVRGYLTVLILGVATPLMLEHLKIKINQLFWFVGILLICVFIIHQEARIFSIGFLVLSIEIFRNLPKGFKKIRILNMNVIGLILGLFMNTLSGIFDPYLSGIASIHFIVITFLVGSWMYLYLNKTLSQLFIIASWLMALLLVYSACIRGVTVSMNLSISVIGFCLCFLTLLQIIKKKI